MRDGEIKGEWVTAVDSKRVPVSNKMTPYCTGKPKIFKCVWCICKVAIGRYAVRAGVSVLVELSMFVSEEAEESPSPTSRRAIVLRLIKLCQLSGKLRDESQSPLKMVVN